MDENEEDIEENDSDSDGEVINMASQDLMCSTPPAVSHRSSRVAFLVLQL